MKVRIVRISVIFFLAFTLFSILSDIIQKAFRIQKICNYVRLISRYRNSLISYLEYQKYKPKFLLFHLFTIDMTLMFLKWVINSSFPHLLINIYGNYNATN